MTSDDTVFYNLHNNLINFNCWKKINESWKFPSRPKDNSSKLASVPVRSHGLKFNNVGHTAAHKQQPGGTKLLMSLISIVLGIRVAFLAASGNLCTRSYVLCTWERTASPPREEKWDVKEEVERQRSAQPMSLQCCFRRAQRRTQFRECYVSFWPSVGQQTV